MANCVLFCCFNCTECCWLGLPGSAG